MSLPKDNKDSVPEPAKGLEGVVAADTNLSSVNGEKGILRYCGYNIDDLASKINASMPDHVIETLKKGLNGYHKELKNSKILCY